MSFSWQLAMNTKRVNHGDWINILIQIYRRLSFPLHPPPVATELCIIQWMGARCKWNEMKWWSCGCAERVGKFSEKLFALTRLEKSFPIATLAAFRIAGCHAISSPPQRLSHRREKRCARVNKFRKIAAISTHEFIIRQKAEEKTSKQENVRVINFSGV